MMDQSTMAQAKYIAKVKLDRGQSPNIFSEVIIHTGRKRELWWKYSCFPFSFEPDTSCIVPVAQYIEATIY